MAFTVREYVTSRRVVRSKDTRNATLEFVGHGESDDSLARAGFAAAIPTTFTDDGETLTLINWESNTLGGLLWRAVAYYAPDGAPVFPAADPSGLPPPVIAVPGIDDPLPPNFAFDFTGVSEHITQSKETVSRTNRGGGAAPNNQRAIGVTADGKVEGCDRVSPNQEWSVTVTFEYVTMTYLILLEGLVGTTNDAEFYHRPAKSTVFMGGTCQIDDTKRAKVTFKFLTRPNVTNVVICDDLIVPAKNGSEYLWVSYKDASTGNKLFQQPGAAYVERICDAEDWSQFRIGT